MSHKSKDAQADRLREPTRADEVDGPSAPTFAPQETALIRPAQDRIATFGDYELLEEIARGGMGVVYKARQQRLQRIVALKMILTGQFASAAEVERFRTEAEAAAQLDHPNIVPIYDIGEYDGRQYFTMRLIEGGPLSRNIATLTHDLEQSVRIAATVARTVHFGHQRGILHRDLKPANILLDKHGQPHVTDFGLAKRAQDDRGQTDTGTIVGTPSYMAPEQAAGKKSLTTAVDVYSLGAILYELLAAQPPFRGDTNLETLFQVVEKEPLPPRLLNPRVDRDLETVCLKCLEKEPIRRYASALELADELDLWLKGAPVRARPCGQAERLVKWIKRRPAVSALVLMSLTTIVLGMLLVVQLYRMKLVAARSEADQERQTSEQEREARLAVEKERDARQRAFVRFEGVRQSALSELVRRENPGLALLLGIEGAERHSSLLANNALLAAWNECFEQRTLLGHDAEVLDACFSPDGNYVLTASADGRARAWNVKNGNQELCLRAVSAAVVAARFSRDGRRILTVSQDGSARIWDTASGQLLFEVASSFATAPPRADPWHFAQMSPNGKLLAVAGASLRIFHVESGRLMHSIANPSGTILGVAFDPYGQRLITFSTGRTARIHQIVSGKELLVLTTPDEIAAAAFTSDGRWLVVLHRSADKLPRIRIWDASANRQLATLTPPLRGTSINTRPRSMARILLSADGRRMTTVSQLQDHISEQDLWELPSGRHLAVLGRGQSAKSTAAPTLSPDDRWLVGGDGGKHANIRAAGTGDKLFVLKGHQDTIGCAAFSPDGRKIVTAGRDATARIWDVPFYADVMHRRGQWNNAAWAAINPAQRQLATATTAPHHSSSISIWDFDHGHEVRRLHGPLTNINFGQFSADGSLLLALSADQSLSVWDVSHEKRLWSTNEVMSACFSPNGSTVLTTEAAGVHVRDSLTGAAVSQIANVHHRLTVQHYAEFSPDGRRILTALDRPRLWDARTGSEIGALPITYRTTKAAAGETDASLPTMPAHPGAQHLHGTFSPDGRWIVTGHTYDNVSSVRLWHATTLRQVMSVSGMADSLSFDLSRDGQLLAAAMNDATIQVIETSTGRCVGVGKAHEGEIIAVAFSPSAAKIVSCSRDGTARVWDARSGKELMTIQGGTDGFSNARFTWDGRDIVTTSAAGIIRIWPVDVVAAAKLRKPRDLSEAERRHFEIDRNSRVADEVLPSRGAISAK